MTKIFPCVNSKKTFSNGYFCHFKFCYNKINQFCNTVQNLATKLPSAITATLFFFQLLLCVVILMIALVELVAALFSRKFLKNYLMEEAKIALSFLPLAQLSSFFLPYRPTHQDGLNFYMSSFFSFRQNLIRQNFDIVGTARSIEIVPRRGPFLVDGIPFSLMKFRGGPPFG